MAKSPAERSVIFQQEMHDRFLFIEKTLEDMGNAMMSLDRQNDNVMVLLSAIGDVMISKGIVTEPELKTMTAQVVEAYNKERERVVAELARKQTNEALSNMLHNGPFGRA